MFFIIKEPIDPQFFNAHLQNPSFGAQVCFLGIVRNHHEGKDVCRIFYECYEKMALNVFLQIETDAKVRFPGVDFIMVHRTGMVEVSQASVLVTTASAHRKIAYECNIWLMDRIKELLPVWKKEFHPDGKTSWVNIGA